MDWKDFKYSYKVLVSREREFPFWACLIKYKSLCD